mmetsp:Transcript_48670/g.150633  ORF Transcript_48670/g.150633 Transcript_48670/m.150633 type:complete len:341 (-) Transcript_48670:358-1380(-)
MPVARLIAAHRQHVLLVHNCFHLVVVATLALAMLPPQRLVQQLRRLDEPVDWGKRHRHGRPTSSMARPGGHQRLFLLARALGGLAAPVRAGSWRPPGQRPAGLRQGRGQQLHGRPRLLGHGVPVPEDLAQQLADLGLVRLGGPWRSTAGRPGPRGHRAREVLGRGLVFRCAATPLLRAALHGHQVQRTRGHHVHGPEVARGVDGLGLRLTGAGLPSSDAGERGILAGLLRQGLGLQQGLWLHRRQRGRPAQSLKEAVPVVGLRREATGLAKWVLEGAWEARGGLHDGFRGGGALAQRLPRRAPQRRNEPFGGLGAGALQDLTELCWERLLRRAPPERKAR